MPYEVVKHILNAKAKWVPKQHLHALLSGSGAVRRDMGLKPEEENNGNKENKKFHGEMVRDGIFGIYRFDVQCSEKGCRHLPENSID